MKKKSKTRYLYYIFLVLIFLRVISSLAITNFYRDLYSFAFTITYLVIFIGSLFRIRTAYILATIIALFDMVLGVTMTQGSFFTGAFLVDALILVLSIIVVRQET
jgi:hypothetical protein